MASAGGESQTSDVSGSTDSTPLANGLTSGAGTKGVVGRGSHWPIFAGSSVNTPSQGEGDDRLRGSLQGGAVFFQFFEAAASASNQGENMRESDKLPDLSEFLNGPLKVVPVKQGVSSQATVVTL
jgi:hypothetical protein